MRISAITGEGVDKLLETIESTLNRDKKRVMLLIPYSSAGIIEGLHKSSAVFSTEYTENGILADVIVNAQTYGRVKQFVQEGKA